MIYYAYLQLHNHLFKELSEDKLSVYELPHLLWFDRENQQFIRILDDDGHDVHPIRFPAITVEFGETQWKNNTGDMLITFRVAYESYGDSYQNGFAEIAEHDFDHTTEHNTAQDGVVGSVNQIEALKDLRFLEKVHLALEGFHPAGMTPLVRQASRISNQYGPIIVHEIDYSSRINAEFKEVQYVEVTEICPIPAFPTPPAYNPATLYKERQKVSDLGQIYICLKTMEQPEALANEEFWKLLPEDQLYIIS